MTQHIYMPEPGTTVTAAELRSLGINPECVMCSHRDMHGMPLDVRFGDDRVTRSTSGKLCRYFGYYTKSQILARRLMAEHLQAEFIKQGGGILAGFLKP